jgi:sec-independent protein translocase protein TatA
MPFNIGPGELIIVLVIALVVLGPGKLPDVASSLGKSLREFRKAATDVSDATKIDAPAPTPAPAAPQVAAPNTISGAASPNTLTPTEPASDPDPS